MKKILCGSVFALIATGAMADGFYINPQVAYSITSVSENRVEKSSQNGVWAEFDENKHESWSDTGHKFSPKIAVGYEFNMDKAGILSVEAEYGHVDNFFNAVGFDAAENGDKPNDTDVRNFTYNESTLGLNVKYGYEVYKFIPYVTAGIGYTTIESENNFRSGVGVISGKHRRQLKICLGMLALVLKFQLQTMLRSISRINIPIWAV